MRCPGQDKRSWKDALAYDIPCPRCARIVELFKDEVVGRCRNCDHRFPNPRVSLGCAAWCAHAEECIGAAGDAPPAAGEHAWAPRLLRALEEDVHQAPDAHRALLIFQHAAALLAEEAADARRVLTAALLVPCYCRSSCTSAGRTAGNADALLPALRGRLRELGLDERGVAGVQNLLAAYREEGAADTPELRVLRDAIVLAEMAAAKRSASRWEGAAVPGTWATQGGERRARLLFPDCS